MKDMNLLPCEETTIGYSIMIIIGCGVGYFTIGYLCARKIYTYNRNRIEPEELITSQHI